MSIASEQELIRKAYKKVNGYWVEQPDLTIVFQNIFRKDNNMKKDSVADIEYKNAVDSLQNEAWEKKKAIDDDVKIELVKLEEQREFEAMKARVNDWAEEIYARYEALHKQGFADELAIEILKIYISNH